MTSDLRKDMRGAMAPFEPSLFALESVRVFQLEWADEELSFCLKLTAYGGDGRTELKGSWYGRIPDHILEGISWLLDDNERSSQQLHHTVKPMTVPKILNQYAHSSEPIRWTIVLAHLRSIAEYTLAEAQGAYEQAIQSLETHMVMEDVENTEQAEFAAELAKEIGADNAKNA